MSWTRRFKDGDRVLVNERGLAKQLAKVRTLDERSKIVTNYYFVTGEGRTQVGLCSGDKTLRFNVPKDDAMRV